jgi:fatty acid desaturase
MLTPAEVKELSRTSPVQSVLAIAFDWLGIAGLLWLGAHAPHPLLYVPLVLLMGRQQLALAILMHEAAHKRLFRSVPLNDGVAQLFVAAPVFFALHTYRRTHLKHHQAPLAPDDPDLRLTGGYPISKASLARKLLRDLFGVSYFKFVFHFLALTVKGAPKKPASEAPKPESAPKPEGRREAYPVWVLFVSVLLTHAAVFTALWVTGHPWLFLGLWLVPFMTSLQVLLRIRGIAEHAGYQPGENQLLNTRTVLNPVQVFFFAPHRVNFHLEHHVYPSIPWFNLPKAHQLLRERGALPEDHIYRGYGKILAEVVR